ncbi:hypothetical protein [Streptomyces sp. TR02-1]|uniref:hypothetical protein n=1 Tax=Streptomyces sp. TR02-1 TaxID=3385977 RepID=UPI0039A14B4F
MSTSTEPPVTPEQVTSPWYLLEGNGTSIVTSGPDLRRMVDSLGPDRARHSRDGRIALWHQRGGVSYYRALTQEQADAQKDANRSALQARQDLARSVTAYLRTHGLLYSYDRTTQTLTDGAEVYEGGHGVRVWHRDTAWLQARDPQSSERDARRTAVSRYQDVLNSVGASSEVVGTDLHVRSFPLPPELAAAVLAHHTEDGSWTVSAGGTRHLVLRHSDGYTLGFHGPRHSTLALALLEVAHVSGSLDSYQAAALRQQLTGAGDSGS